ncbi:MAG: FimB/Mfa2 family fimbrial subunit [Muribaculaceae bacterium]
MKRILYLAIVAMLMTACSKDDDMAQLPGDSHAEAGFVKIRLAIDNTMELNRGELYSQDATHKVTNVKVYVFLQSTNDLYYYHSTVDAGWSLGQVPKEIKIPLPSGSYKFIAIGRDASDYYSITNLTVLHKSSELIATVSMSGRESEIFAGEIDAKVSVVAGACCKLELKRKVAGLLGYFKNVPAVVNGKTVANLRLSASKGFTDVNCSLGGGSTIPTTAAYNVIDIALQTQGVTSSGYYTGNDLTSAGVVKLPNSQLAGGFIIPVTGCTMTLGLYDTGGQVIKTWQVLITASPTVDFVANGFYTLGRKMKVDNINGGTPATTDDDDAIDLSSATQCLTLEVKPEWSPITSMIIK